MKKVKIWYANNIYNVNDFTERFDIVHTEIVEVSDNTELWKINRMVQLRTLENECAVGIWNYTTNNPKLSSTNFISGSYNDNPFRLKTIKGLKTINEVGKLNKIHKELV
jgi:hypothetical protein